MAHLEVPDGHLKMHEGIWIKKLSQKESWQFRLTPDRCSDQKVVVIKDFYCNIILRSQIATSSFKKDMVMSEIKSEKAVDLAVIKSESEIRRMIYIVRNQQVMLDSDLASLYHVETKRLNERVKRNQNRFPVAFVSSSHVMSLRT